MLLCLMTFCWVLHIIYCNAEWDRVLSVAMLNVIMLSVIAPYFAMTLIVVSKLILFFCSSTDGHHKALIFFNVSVTVGTVKDTFWL